VSGKIAEILLAANLEPQKVTDLLERKGSFPPYYYSILSSKVIDVDRMDYLKRDTYYTGAVIGEIDVQRLLSVLAVVAETGELCIKEKGVASLEQFLVARQHMYQQVYRHPVSYAVK
jgi:HD superfamily phosphohydrolase